MPGPDEALQDVAVRFLRRALPHHDIADSVYAEVASTLVKSMPDLVCAQAGDPSEVSPTDTRTLVRAALPPFYGHPGTWSVTGFEGPSFDAGGYLDRGFDDLDWLPEPRIVESDRPLAGTSALDGPKGMS